MRITTRRKNHPHNTREATATAAAEAGEQGRSLVTIDESDRTVAAGVVTTLFGTGCIRVTGDICYATEGASK